MSRVFEDSPRNARKHVAGLDPRAVSDRQHRADREEVPRLHTVGQRDHLAGIVAQGDPRTQVGGARLLLPVGHLAERDARRLVDTLLHRHALDQVDVVRRALALGDDRDGIGVPLGEPVTLADPGQVAFAGFAAGNRRVDLEQQPRTVGNAVAGPLAAVLVAQQQFGVAAHDHVHALGVQHQVAVHHLDRRIAGGLEARLLGAALGGAADVEGPHRQLGSGFADRLGCDHADRLADVDPGAARKVAAVAARADPDLGLAGQHGADQQRTDARTVDHVDLGLADDLAGIDQNLVGERVAHVRTPRSAPGCARRVPR